MGESVDDKINRILEELATQKETISALVSRQAEQDSLIAELRAKQDELTNHNTQLAIENSQLRKQMNVAESKSTDLAEVSKTALKRGVPAKRRSTAKKTSSSSSLNNKLSKHNSRTPVSITIEMAATFTNGKFETTFSALKRTQVTQSHALCFYFTSIEEANRILKKGFITAAQQCDGVPLSMHGPEEIVEDDAKWDTQVVLSNKEVVLALSVPRRLLWGFPSKVNDGAFIDNKVSGSFRVIPAQLLWACNGTFTLPIHHNVKRAYQLVSAEQKDKKSMIRNNDRIVCRLVDNTEVCEFSDMNVTNEVIHRSPQTTFKNPNKVLTAPTIEVQHLSNFRDYYEKVSIIRQMEKESSTSTLLLYHYTNPVHAESILSGGLRMSTQGQGDGGVYFSLLGPASYGFGTDDLNSEQEDFETRLIVDCFGRERLHEYYGKGYLSLVLVCAIEEGVLIQAPGGRDNALMVPKEMFESLSCKNENDHYHLPPACIRGAFHLTTSSHQTHGGDSEQDIEQLLAAEIQHDKATGERAKVAMKKLKKLSGNNVLAPLPSSVPELPLAYLARADLVDILKTNLIADEETILSSSYRERSFSLSEVSLKKCVLQGMGGMGKSTVLASVVHDSEVRASFDKIVWISLGQNPDVQALQESVHLQLTGEVIPASIALLPPSIIPEQRKAALQTAASNVNVLLVLDDIWDAMFEHEFNILDLDTNSAMLVSTRIRDLLKDHAIEVSITSLDKKAALSLLLAKAGIDEKLLRESLPSRPAQKSEYELAMDIVNLTGCLPLTLSIAGGLIEANGGEITQDLVDMMKEDKLRSATSGGSGGSHAAAGQYHGSLRREASLEDRLITASLSMFKDDSEHLAMSCFLSFAAFPEDCPIPSLLFDSLASFFLQDAESRKSKHTSGSVSASNSSFPSSAHQTMDKAKLSSPSMDHESEETSHPITSKKGVIHVRKIMTSLVKVNLVSGSFVTNEFTVHDIVRDYAMSRASIDFVQSLNRQIIERLLVMLPELLEEKKLCLEKCFLETYTKPRSRHSVSEDSLRRSESTLSSLSDSDSANYRLSPKMKLLEYLENCLYLHMRSIMGNVNMEEEKQAKLFRIPDNWFNHRHKIVRLSLARALGLQGIQRYGEMAIDPQGCNNPVGAARIYFLATLLLERGEISTNETRPFIEKASHILSSLEYNTKGDASDYHNMQVNDKGFIQCQSLSPLLKPCDIRFELEVVKRHIMVETEGSVSRELEHRADRILLRFKTNPDLYLNISSSNEEERKELEFEMMFSELTTLVNKFRIKTILVTYKDMDEMLALTDEINVLASKASKLAPNPTLSNYIGNLIPPSASFGFAPFGYSQIWIDKAGSRAALRQGVESYDYSICGQAFKESGNGVDYYLQGHFTTMIFVFDDLEILEMYHDRMIYGFQTAYERGLNTFHFMWVEAMGCVSFYLPTLVLFKHYEKAYQILEVFRFINKETYLEDFERFWNDPGRNFGESLKTQLHLTLYLCLIEIHHEYIRYHPELLPVKTSLTTATFHGDKAPQSAQDILFPLPVSKVKELDAVNRFKALSIVTVSSLAARGYLILEMYDEAYELALYGLTPGITIKPITRAMLHRIAAEVHSYQQNKSKAEDHYDEAIREAYDTCYRDPLVKQFQAEKELALH